MVIDRSWPDRDNYPRTDKLLVDNGSATSPADAHHILQSYRLQIIVDTTSGLDGTAQAALLTAINAGRRAFKGGVHVILDDDTTPLSLPWANGWTVADAVVHFGGTLAPSPLDTPTLLIGPASTVQQNAPVLQLSWSGWTGAATVGAGFATSSHAITLAGVVAAALGVSELFQHNQGAVEAGRRDVGLNLWNPGSNWRYPAEPPPLQFLPETLWILGLGHLGQAAIWNLGCLPYPAGRRPRFTLMDTDTFVTANIDTGLLADTSSVGRRKTVVAASRLEAIGVDARLVERRFDGTIQLASDEPTVAIAGFDNPEARRALENSFPFAVDAGLGAGSTDYLDILIHSFPGDLSAVDAFPNRPTATSPALPDAYEAEVKRRIEAGEDGGDARCGVVEAAGATVGAAFVGAVAGALVVGDVLRSLHGGPRFTVVSVDLAEPDYSKAIANERRVAEHNPGFIETAPIGPLETGVASNS